MIEVFKYLGDNPNNYEEIDDIVLEVPADTSEDALLAKIQEFEELRDVVDLRQVRTLNSTMRDKIDDMRTKIK